MEKFQQIKEQLEEINPDAILLDEYEFALIGISRRFNMPPITCYDYDKCINILVTRDKMSYEEAVEYFNFNTLGCWAGEHTPIFLYKQYANSN
jgi:hypothetical protein